MNNTVESFLVKANTKTGFSIKKSGFKRYISKSGFILGKAYGESDVRGKRKLQNEFEGIEKIHKMCSSNVKDGICRAVWGSFLLGSSPSEIEEGLKDLDLWKFD